MNAADTIVTVVRAHYPSAQAIYLFGSYGTEDEWPNSDVDIALLLPHAEARARADLGASSCREALSSVLGREVDLLNARAASTVFQKEIVTTGRRLFRTNDDAADEFEMYTLSLYERLNEERAEILRAFADTGRAYAV